MLHEYVISACLGGIVVLVAACWIYGRTIKDLEAQLGVKRAAWCLGCLLKAELIGAREKLTSRDRSITELSKVLRQQVFEIPKLKTDLGRGNRVRPRGELVPKVY